MTNKNDIHQEFLKAYEAFSDGIFRHIYFRLMNRERALELMQDTFMKTWDYIGKKGAKDTIKSLLYKIANNLLIDEYRKKKEESLEQLAEKGIVPKVAISTEKIDIKMESEKALKVMEKLEDKYKEAITMRYVEEMSIQEMAETTGESENNISVRINRALKQLKQLLNG
ncbi:MAG: ECF subfamily RNA polymerase sigma-24 subunit, RNA polymerase sigma-70 factor, ECF subfamily [Candidatus Peregrinibacteria bacterium GW2011_GWF2_38_29]|nr:MAG: ECF subfamily RNA polymerase sigma-24 subunit, RNA polymerase sigma-70 factor, ECF subfamily [Candidatus Peregrinibacteria bacterium GW2011_GWF2_38_29]HBB02161.1 hypothetical protein [Candidatus Peregrinibacteria bacterium]